MILDEGTLSTFVDNAHALVAEAKIQLNDGGIRLAAVDPANVAMLDETLDAAAFESYDESGGVIGVNLERLSNVVGFADNGELVHLELDEETRKLHVEIGTLEYTIALIDPDSIRQEPEIPDVEEELSAKLVVEARELQRACKAGGLCSDHIAFGANVDDEVFYAESEGDTVDMRYEWPREDTIEGSYVDGTAHSLYSLDYIDDVLKPIRSGAEVSLRVGEEYPMFMDCSFADGDGDLRYMVAPRVQS